MKNPLHLGNDEARSLLASPLTILAWLEATALKMELAAYIKRSRESDVWYVSRDNETFGPVPFAKILRMLLRGGGPIPVLHGSEVEMDPAPWRTISYNAWPVNAAMRLAWTVGFWLVAVALGFVALTLACPVSARPIVGPAYLVVVVAAGIWLRLRARRVAPTPIDQETSEAEPQTEAEPE